MEGILEGLLYVQGDMGLTLEQIASILEIDKDKSIELINNLEKEYKSSNRGLKINYLGNTYKLTTKEEHKEYYQKLLENPKTHMLTQTALETLAIIAYNEPITRIEVDDIRGVDSAYIIRKLLAKGLIIDCGKKDVLGHPTLYRTTNEFLDYFGLATISDLPKIEINKEEETEKDLYASIYKEKEDN